MLKYFSALIPRKLKLYYKRSFLNFLFRLAIEHKFKSKAGKFDEAEIAAEFLPEKVGFYIDIGAGTPIEASNTYLFYRRGWRGICIDPIAINEKLHKVFRPHDKFLRLIVGNSLGRVKFFEFIPSGYSTTDQKAATELLKKQGVFLIHTRFIQGITLASIAPNVSPESATLLSIDAEGEDLDVLKSNDFKLFSPRVIICEDYKIYSESVPSFDLDIFLGNFQYKLVKISGYSKIFVHRDYLDKI